MDNAFLLIGLVAVIWVTFILLRAPATIIFFSLLVGQLMAVQLSNEAYDLITNYTSQADFRYVQVVLLVLPVVITLLILRGRVSSSKRIIEAVPLLLAAASIMILADNYLGLSQNLQPQQNVLLRTYEGLIVSSGAVLSLVSSWLSYPGAHKGKHKKH